jgi:hypothetical protein
MTKRDKLIERIKTNIQIKYPSSSAVEEIINYVKQKTIELHPTVNIVFEQSRDGGLEIIVKGRGTVEPFLKTLDKLLVHIREIEKNETRKNINQKQNNSELTL